MRIGVVNLAPNEFRQWQVAVLSKQLQVVVLGKTLQWLAARRNALVGFASVSYSDRT